MLHSYFILRTGRKFRRENLTGATGQAAETPSNADNLVHHRYFSVTGWNGLTGFCFSGILGLCAFVEAFPYDVPSFLPGVLMELSTHLNDPQVAARSLKSVLVLPPQIFGPFGPPKKRVNFNKINQRHKCVIFLSPICSLNIFCPYSCLSS